MDQFSLLGSTASQLQQEFIRIYYLALPAFFALALLFDWVRNPRGSPDFVDTLKRAFIATILVASFKEISDGIFTLATAISDRISDLSGLDQIIQMASDRCKTYHLSSTSILLGFNDFMISVFSFGSYLLLYLARYITVALYHFMWLLLSILSPPLMLFYLFRATESIPIHLFKTLCEVACWRIVWAVLSVMITSLSFGNAYAADGQYVTVLILNFVIAIAMLGTPLVVKALIGNGLSSLSETLAAGATAALVAGPGKLTAVASVGREVLSNTAGFVKGMGQGSGVALGSGNNHPGPASLMPQSQSAAASLSSPTTAQSPSPNSPSNLIKDQK